MPVESSDGVDANRLEDFRNVLSIVLIVASVFIAVVGTLAFIALRRLLADSIEKVVNERVWRAVTASRGTQGYNLGQLYEATMNPIFLKLALEVHEDMKDHLHELDESRHISEKTICEFRNNWGYLLTLRAAADVKPGEDKLALSFAKYIEERIHKYPENAVIWGDTIDAINRKFG